jgi:NAD(P)H-nitrite reductase large subunit
MREALAELIVEGGEAYERLYAHLSYEPDPEKDNRSQRVQLIQNVMSAYRERAKSRMLIACPEVRAGIARMKQKSLMIKRETAQNLGAMDMVRQLEGQMDAWKEFENDQDGSGDMFQDLLEDASPEQRQQLEGAFPQ